MTLLLSHITRAHNIHTVHYTDGATSLHNFGKCFTYSDVMPHQQHGTVCNH